MTNLFKILILSLLLFSCNNTSNDLIGSWKIENPSKDCTNIYIFNKDNTGMRHVCTGEVEPYSWKVEDNILTINHSTRGSGPVIYRISNDKMYWDIMGDTLSITLKRTTNPSS